MKNIFDLFKGKSKENHPTWKDIPPPDETEDADNVIKFPEPRAVPPVPPVQPPKPAAKECYRIGRRDDGMTTLTVMSGDGFGSITLAMNEPACEQLIKMLRASYDGTESAS